jgi:transposase
MVNRKRFIGIDLSKRGMVVAFSTDENEKIELKKFKNSIEGRQNFISKLKKTDIVALETGNCSFVLAKNIISKVGCKVYVLNAGKLQFIFRSLKKTDKEDAIKINRFIQRNPENELPFVKIPDDKEVAKRSSVSEGERLSRMKTQCINALHNLFWNDGITELKKKDLHNPKDRIKNIKRLSIFYKKQAERLNNQLELFEKQIEELEIEQTEMLKENIEETMISMSVPGIGPKATLAIQAFLGNMERFSSAKQVSFFVGFVPKLDCSGEQNRYGDIIKTGSKQIKRIINQASWAAIRSKSGFLLKEFYERISSKRGKGRAIVAVSRKILEIVYILLKTNSLYENGMDDSYKRTMEKLISYNLVKKPEKKRKRA